MSIVRPSLICLALLLGACAKPSTPVAGDYRAHVELRGGEAPFTLRLNSDQGTTHVSVVLDGTSVPATEVSISEGSLTAKLPNGLGTLQATLGSKSLKGELRLTDVQGHTHALPFAAELGKSYRFVESSSTDNADVSGDWQLEVTDGAHFSSPTSLHLTQMHDAVDGQWQLTPTTVASVHGQVMGDDVSLSAFGPGRILLFKGKINSRGELQGDLWSNLDAAHPAVAKHAAPDQQTQDTVRKVALPWAVPTREFEPPTTE